MRSLIVAKAHTYANAALRQVARLFKFRQIQRNATRRRQVDHAVDDGTVGRGQEMPLDYRFDSASAGAS